MAIKIASTRRARNSWNLGIDGDGKLKISLSECPTEEISFIFFKYRKTAAKILSSSFSAFRHFPYSAQQSCRNYYYLRWEMHKNCDKLNSEFCIGKGRKRLTPKNTSTGMFCWVLKSIHSCRTNPLVSPTSVIWGNDTVFKGVFPRAPKLKELQIFLWGTQVSQVLECSSLAYEYEGTSSPNAFENGENSYIFS